MTQKEMLDSIRATIDENASDFSRYNGVCKTCPFKKKCVACIREERKREILHIDASMVRFKLAKRVADAFPFLLDLVPEAVYRKMYPVYPDGGLPCSFSPDKLVSGYEMIKECFCMLSDDVSKEVYYNAIMARLKVDLSYSKKNLAANGSDSVQYFPSFLPDELDGAFVDCGAFAGDTLEDYLSRRKKLDIYYPFEPSSENVSRLKDAMERLGVEGVVCNKGCYDKSGKIYFVQGGTGSFISESPHEGGEEIEVVSIDDFFEENSSAPCAFIKMDIEGSEQKALVGAEKIIKRDKPYLAICIYHKPEDLYEIPLYIKNTFPEYNKFYIRQYGIFSEIVFYAFVE